MLLRLMPDQIANYWDVIKYALEESLPPIAGEHPDKMNRILSSLIGGSSQCWVSYEKKEDTKRFEGVVVTQIIKDEISDTTSLLLYSVYGYDYVSEETWKKGFETLVRWGMSRGCTRIIGYTDSDRLIQIVKSLGGTATHTFVSIPLR